MEKKNIELEKRTEKKFTEEEYCQQKHDKNYDDDEMLLASILE